MLPDELSARHAAPAVAGMRRTPRRQLWLNSGDRPIFPLFFGKKA